MTFKPPYNRKRDHVAPPPRSERQHPSKTSHAAWIPVAITALVIGAVFILVYVGLQRAPVPRGLPIAVVSEQLASAAEDGWGDRVAVTEVDSLEAGTRMVRDGEVVALVSLTSPTSVHLDYAGAKGLTETGAARALVDGFAQQAGLTVEETDLVPFVQYDCRGLSSFYVVFGVTLASFILAQGLTGAAAKIRLRHRLYALSGFAVLIGIVGAAIAGPLLGALATPFALLAATLALLSAAVAFTTKALVTWLGPLGNGVAVLVLTTVGNAVSGATIGFDILPAWAQAISGALPPGAAFRAIIDLGYFSGAGAWLPLVVLAIWALVGFALVLLRAALRGQKKDTATEQAHADASPVAIPAA